MSARSAERLGSRLIPAALLVLAAAIFFVRMSPDARPTQPHLLSGKIDAGEGLLHGLPPAKGRTSVSFHMPLYPFLAAIGANHIPQAAKTPLAAAAANAGPLLAGALGLLLWPLCLPAVLLLLPPETFEVWREPEFAVYTPAILTAAAMLVRFARGRSPGTAAAFGVSVGAGLLCRSTLFLLPPFAALAGFAADRRAGRRSDPRVLIPLLVLPYLFLIPWVSMNAALFGGFVPFEHRRAQGNMVTGALGLVPTVEGDWLSLVPDRPDPERPGAVEAWAVREVLRHPFRYAWAWVRRVARALSFHPLLAAAAFAAFLFMRGDPGVLALGGLAAYWFGIHALMPVEEKYFFPIWPVVAVIAASPLARIKAPAVGLPGARRFAERAFGAALAFLAASACAAALKAGSYAARSEAAAGTAAWDRVVAAFPEDAWALTRRAEARLAAGDAAGAARDFGEAMKADPGDRSRELRLAFAQFLQGRDAPVLGYEIPADHGTLERAAASLLKALASRRAGRAGEEKRHLAALRAEHERWLSEEPRVRRVSTERERRALETLRAAQRSGEASRALVCQIVDRYHSRLEGGSASVSEAMLREAFPGRAGPCLAKSEMDKGVAAFRRGAAAGAVPFLERAVRADPGLLQAYLSLGTVLESLGRPPEAADAYARGAAAGEKAGRTGAVLDHLREGRDRLR